MCIGYYPFYESRAVGFFSIHFKPISHTADPTRTCVAVPTQNHEFCTTSCFFRRLRAHIPLDFSTEEETLIYIYRNIQAYMYLIWVDVSGGRERASDGDEKSMCAVRIQSPELPPFIDHSQGPPHFDGPIYAHTSMGSFHWFPHLNKKKTKNQQFSQ